MAENEELEFDTPLEEEVETIDVPADKRKIYTELGDPEVESLHGKRKRGKLIVQPDFQRQFGFYVQSHIKSIMLRLQLCDVDDKHQVISIRLPFCASHKQNQISF